ncbi:MAG: type II/IV secretion system protein [Deltaproteobacteria bacterium]|nr:type II/IV secretion system protein [Deltaproteobacteria bacterium]
MAVLKTHPRQRKKIAEILLSRGYITQEQMDYVLSLKEKGSKERVGNIFIKDGLINDTHLAHALAEQSSKEFADLSQFEPDDALISSVPLDLMYRYQFIPYERRDGEMLIAVSDPTNVMGLDEVRLMLDTPIRVLVGAASEIQEILKRVKGADRVVKDVSEDVKFQLVKETEEGEEVLSAERLTDDMSPIIRLIDSTILDALNKRASDIHIESMANAVAIKYRIDGVLYEATKPIDPHFQGPIISRIKVMSELDISEKRVPQDGRFKLKYKGRSIDFRVSIMPSIFGEDAVIRILDKESITKEFHELRLDILGFSERELVRIRKMIREPYGMVLVTGPTGSGKTTTLYAALSEIRTGQDKIITIEDPPEYQLSGIVQVPVNEKKGLTFARGLRSILRHDPDKIMVGEIRDAETAQIAVQSALTGHLVFTTVHANNVFDVIGRFIHMNIEPYNFVSSLNCVLAQRLVRTLCGHCKAPVKADARLLEESGLPVNKYRDFTFYEARGCRECNGTGFRGRTAIVELLDLTDEIREMIVERHSSAILKKAAREAGTTFLRDAALEKVFEGKSTLQEINRVTFVE